MATTTALSAPEAPNDDVPELWSTQPRYLDRDLTLTDTAHLDVPHADAAFRYDATDPDGREHVLFEVYAIDPGKKLSMWIIDTTSEEANEIGATLVAVSGEDDSDN